VLLARATNVPGVFVVDRITIPGGGFIRTDNEVTLNVVYIDGSTDTLTINGGFIPTKRIARIFIPPGEKVKRFTIEVHDEPPMMTDGSNIFPTPGSNTFPTITQQPSVQASVYSSQIISNGASFSGSGWGRLALHIIGGGGGGGGGAASSGSGGSGGSVSQSPYYTYQTSNNAFATSVSVSGGSGGTSSSACTAGSNAGYYGAGGGGGGSSAAGCNGGSGGPGAVFIGIISEYANVYAA